jgi:hypothetical protein
MKRETKTMIFGLLYLAVAALMFIMGRYIHREILEKGSWPTTPGKLLERGLGPKMQATGRGTFLPRVKYRYVVNGTEYVGDQCYLIRGSGGLERQVLKLVNDLPETLPVHYDPANPAQAYLLVNPLSTYWILMGFAVLAALLGLMQIITSRP